MQVSASGQSSLWYYSQSKTHCFSLTYTQKNPPKNYIVPLYRSKVLSAAEPDLEGAQQHVLVQKYVHT